MGRVIRFQGGQLSCITEADPENLLCLANRIAKDQQLFDQLAEGVLEKLMADAEIEPSPHTLEYEVIESNCIREERLLVDGVVRYRRLRGSGMRLATKQLA